MRSEADETAVKAGIGLIGRDGTISGANAAARDRLRRLLGVSRRQVRARRASGRQTVDRECLEETGLRVVVDTPQAPHALPVSPRPGGAALLRLHAP